MMIYTVPENYRLVPLCINVGAIDSVNNNYTITAQLKSITKAEGWCKYAINTIIGQYMNECQLHIINFI